MENKKVTIEFHGNDLNLIHEYEKQSGAINIQTAIMNAISIALDENGYYYIADPVAPQKHYNQKADLLYACGKCHNDLKPNNRNAKFCWFCGTPVLWK